MRYLLIVALLCGCGDDDSTDSGVDGGTDAGTDAAVDAVGDVQPDTADAGPQTLTWTACRSGRGECALLTVPIDYEDEGAGTMELPVYRLPALSDRMGVLFVAAGSGGSGVALADNLPGFGTPGLGEVLRRFDVVGLDVRGNGNSVPGIACFADEVTRAAALDAVRAAAPDDDAVATEARALLDTCRSTTGVDLRHFSTSTRVRDIDLLRTLLEEEQLSFIGISYGTWTSTAYALRHPDRVRAAALFSPLAVQDLFDRLDATAHGLDDALTGFLDWCDATDSCAFKPLAGTTRERFDALASTLSEDERGVVVSILDGILRVIRGRSVAREYGDAADVLLAAETDASALPAIAPTNADERSLIEYVLDLTTDASYADWRARATTLRSELVSWGPLVSDWDIPVLFGVAYEGARDVVALQAIPEAPPFLLVTGDLDPITPRAGATDLATALGNGSVVLDAQIVGHNTLSRNPCALGRANDYLLNPSSLEGSPAAIECPEIGADETVIGSVSATFEWAGEFDSRLVETPIGNLVADAMRAEASTQLALINGGGIRTALPAAIVRPTDMALRRAEAGYAAGPPYDVIVDDVRAMLPFGNRVTTIDVTGEQLWAFMEETLGSYDGTGMGNQLVQISGFTLSFDASATAGSRVLALALEGGEAIANDESTTYSLALVDFVYYGGTDVFTLIDLPATFGRSIDEVLVDYIMANSGTPGTDLVPATEGRIDIN